jgi:1,4-alpha-glucan branching enzyme
LYFTQVIRENYRIGIPRKGKLKEILIVMQKYGGSAVKNLAKLAIEASPYDGRDYSIELTLAL